MNLSKMKILPGFLSVAAVVISLASCEVTICRIPGDSGREVSFVLADYECIARSSMTVSEDNIEDVVLMVYAGGMLVTDRYYTSFSSMSMTLLPDTDYSFYALANVGEIQPPLCEDDISSLALPVDDSRETLPMCWSCRCAVPADGVMTVSLERLYAKVVLNVDNKVPGLFVSAVTLEQVPSYVRPFAPAGNRALSGETVSGDCAAAEDLRVLNEGESICLYMPENRQGVLLEGNEDPMNKVPDSLPDLSELCSYLEVACAFEAGGDKEGEVTYRMYLGNDIMSDFNVDRNKILSISLGLTPSGLGVKESWKVCADYIQHASSLRVDSEELELVAGCSANLNVRVYPDDVCDPGVEWISSDSSVALVGEDGKVTAVGRGECVITAVSTDRADVYDECRVTVVPVAPESLELNASELRIPLGENYVLRYRVHYNDGTASSFISYGYASLKACSPDGWTVSDESVAVISAYGTVTPLVTGKTDISMTVGWWVDDEYFSCSASCEVCVTDAYVVSVSVKAPAMFYPGSGGPGLYGLMSDGSESQLVADEWTTSVPQISMSPTSGITISDEDSLVDGETVCTFTAYYNGMSASVDMLYGKWVKGIRCVKTLEPGTGQYRYRIAVVYDDFSEKFVPFRYEAVVDDAVGVKTGTASAEGLVLDWAIDEAYFETSEEYRDYTGVLKVWNTHT